MLTYIKLHGHLSVTSSADSKSFTPTKGGEGAKGNIGAGMTYIQLFVPINPHFAG